MTPIELDPPRPGSTAIITIDGHQKVVYSKDLKSYLSELKRRKKRLEVLFVTQGDYKGKINNFGIKRFLACNDAQDDTILYKLVFDT